MKALRWIGMALMLAWCGGCVSGGAGGPAIDEQVRDLAGSAQEAYRRGDVARAEALYARALERARLIGDRQETGRNAYNLALCHIARGDAEGARRLLDQARALVSSKGPEMARLWLAEAESCRGGGRAGDGAALAQRALDAGAGGPERAQARLLLAEGALEAGDGESARRMLDMARKDLRGVPEAEPVLMARAEAVAAQLARTQGRTADEAAAREAQAGWLRQAGCYRDMAAALLEAGRSYREAGRSIQACRCLLAGAASLKASGNRDGARAATQEAIALARESGDAESLAAAESMAAEIGRP